MISIISTYFFVPHLLVAFICFIWLTRATLKEEKVFPEVRDLILFFLFSWTAIFGFAFASRDDFPRGFHGAVSYCAIRIFGIAGSLVVLIGYTSFACIQVAGFLQ